MLALTQAVKSPPLKIGKISNDIVLPRAVPVATAAVVVVFAILGAIVTLLLVGGTAIITGAAIFGFLGYILANYSPLKGESFLRWMTLASGAKRKQLEIDGEPVIPYVGVARIPTPAAGNVSWRAGSLEVNPVHYDERGVLRKESLLSVPEYQPLPLPFPEDTKTASRAKKRPTRSPKVKASRPRKMPT